MKKWFVQILSLSLSFHTYCQYPEIRFEQFTYKQGLDDEGIRAMVQDDKGFMWVAESRLYKFDGYAFTPMVDLPGCRVFPADTLWGISALIKDDLGIIWIVFDAGIVLLDPENQRSELLKQFACQGSAILDWGNSINILKGKENVIWISRESNLIKLTLRNDLKKPVTKNKVFDSNFHDIFDMDTFKISSGEVISQNRINNIYEDKWGNIWTGCMEGLYFLKKGEKSFIRLDDEGNGKSKLTNAASGSLIQANDDTFFMVNWYEIVRITNVKAALTGEYADKKLLVFSKNRQLSDHPRTLLKDRNQNIFIGTDKDIYMMKKGTAANEYNFLSLYQGKAGENEDGHVLYIIKMMQDKNGAIWAGHGYHGLLKFNLEKSRFISYKKLIGGELSRISVGPMVEDRPGNLWLAGGFPYGIYRIDPDNKVTYFNVRPGKAGSIVCMKEIRPGIFWLGHEFGLYEFNSNTGRLYDPFPKSRASINLSKTHIWDILADGNLVYCCTSSGIFITDLKGSRLLQFTVSSNDSSYVDRKNIFFSLIKSKDGSIWTVSNSDMGLCKIVFDPSTENLSFIKYETPYLSSKNLIHKYNEALFQDEQGIFWVGNIALHRIDINTGVIKSFKLFQGLQIGLITSITEDKNNNLWIGTEVGLLRFNKLTGEIRKYTGDDGVPVRAHDHHSVLKSKTGSLFFGGIGGFYSFRPDSMKKDSTIPPVFITDFRISNKSIHVNSEINPILTKQISYTSKIELNHDQNDISFEFAALDYTQPIKNKYAYKLEGYQDDWVETDAKNRVATFTNLDPGKYVFHVKGSNSDGTWNEEGTSIVVNIHKPWWGTAFAWVIYVLVFVGAVSSFLFWRLSALKKEKLVLENQVHERTRQIEEQKEEILTQKEAIVGQRDILIQQNQQITELDQLKTRFFTNISHEFRTPLSLIQNPLEELLDDPRRNKKERQKLNLVQHNAGRLLSLVNQLLDISKLDGRGMKLEIVESDVMKHLKAVAGGFSSMAEVKSIKYVLDFPAGEYLSWFDPDKLEKIALNLLSNAFKFTPEGGDITFAARYAHGDHPRISKYLEFFVKDTGTGIPVASLEKIFDRFYQVETSIKREGGGTGIGLSLARELARLMHGDITVESEMCKGSAFTVLVPLGMEHLGEKEFIILKTPRAGNTVKPYYNENWTGESEPDYSDSSRNEKPVLLVVEDNRDIRSHLSENLLNEYLVIEAIDGIAGLKKATELIPDLVITDIMMPRMDGMELCHKLKNDERTCHIPVIMLTAKVSHSDKISGYQTGADDYIPKPFLMSELKARITNLLKQRQKLKDWYSRVIKLESSDIKVTSLDEQFLKKAIEIVEKHIGDENFDLPEFRSEMNMSRSTLLRKMQALTGESPTNFIRTIRLKRAGSLLKKNYGNVTQVSYEVGFNNLSYFNKAFKKFYGISPKQYAKANLNS